MIKRLLYCLRRPTLDPGLYRLGTSRLWDADELEVIWSRGRWCVRPKGVRR